MNTLTSKTRTEQGTAATVKRDPRCRAGHRFRYVGRIHAEDGNLPSRRHNVHDADLAHRERSTPAYVTDRATVGHRGDGRLFGLKTPPGRVVFGTLPSWCDRPSMLGCTRCGERVMIRCSSSNPARCMPCADTHRSTVEAVFRNPMLLHVGRAWFLTLTAPGARAHHEPRYGWADGPRGKVFRCIGDDPSATCSCTAAGGTDLGVWNAKLPERFNRFMQALRRLLGVDVQYARTIETQGRGALHEHLLIRSEDGDLALTDEQLLAVASLAVEHGYGHQLDVAPVDNPVLAAWYLAKYIAKSTTERAAVPWVTTAPERKRASSRSERLDSEGRPSWHPLAERDTEVPVPERGQYDDVTYTLHGRQDAVRHRAGVWVNPTTGEVRERPRYRSWSASRKWGSSLAVEKDRQRLHARARDAELAQLLRSPSLVRSLTADRQPSADPGGSVLGDGQPPDSG